MSQFPKTYFPCSLQQSVHSVILFTTSIIFPSLRMFSFCIIIFFVMSVHASIIHIPEVYMVNDYRSVSRHWFYPDGVKTIQESKKSKILYGTNCPDDTHMLMNHIDSLPVEERLDDLVEFGSKSRRFYNIPNLITSDYRRFVYSSRFIDVRLLRLLIRFATQRLRQDEIGITSACDILKFMRNKFSQSRLDYLTPDYILAWYDLLGGSQMGLQAVEDKYILNQLFSDNDPNHAVFLQLSYVHWREAIVAPRIKRLSETGYEFL